MKQGEVKQVEVKQVEMKQVEVKQVEVKQTEVKQVEVKQVDVQSATLMAFTRHTKMTLLPSCSQPPAPPSPVPQPSSHLATLLHLLLLTQRLPRSSSWSTSSPCRMSTKFGNK